MSSLLQSVIFRLKNPDSALKDRLQALQADQNLIKFILADLESSDFHLNTWKKNGCKTFILSKTLIEAFQNTDIPLDMYYTQFKYPFDSFVLESNTIPFFYTRSAENTVLGSRSDVEFPVTVICFNTYEKIFQAFLGFEPPIALNWNVALVAFFSSGFSVGKIETLIQDRIDVKGTSPGSPRYGQGELDPDDVKKWQIYIF
jgi:hypothetical protein